MILDVSFGGYALLKIIEEVITIIELMASTYMRGEHGKASV